MRRSMLFSVAVSVLIAMIGVAPAVADRAGTAGLSDLTIECRVVPNHIGTWSQYCMNSDRVTGPYIADIRVPGTEALNYTYQWTWNGTPPTSVFNGCTSNSRDCAVWVSSYGLHTARAVATDPRTGATRLLEATVDIYMG